MKRYFKAFGYLLSVHVLALLVMTLFRLVEFIALHGMIVDAEASRVMAFVKGVWFDNVIACYISVLPVAVLLIAASLGWCHRRLLRGINIWYAAWFAIAFMPSAANTPYFQYFFKNINSSIFGWFGYVATTSGMLLQESSFWLYIALYFVFTGAFIYALVRLRRYFEGLFLLPKDNMHLVQVVSRFLISAVMIGACLFGIRGRMGYNPIKVSQAYYCEDSFLNQLGINPAFNLLTSALDDMRKENKELHLMPYAEAITNTRQWLGITGKVDSTNILKREVVNDSLMMKMGQSPAKKNHPNVVVILMESMSANLLGTFGNQQPLTPTLDSLPIFYYGQDKNVLVKTDSLDLSSSHSIKQHSYKAMGNVRRTKLESFFEGNEDSILYVGEIVRFENFSNFRVNISSQNEGVRLRRLSDQNDARQAARVFVDGEEVTERLWYVADSNPYKRWLEDDFEIPVRYTKGKKSLNIRIVPVSMFEEGNFTWNEAEYQVFCYII